MKPSVRRMVIIFYNLSQLLGLIAFSVNYDTGRIKTKPYITVYSAAISLLMFATVPLLFHMQWKSRVDNGPELHYKVTALVCLIRILAVLITVVLNWTKRQEFIESIRDFQCLRRNVLRKFQMTNKVQQYFERGIQMKFYWGLMSNITYILTSYNILQNVFDMHSPFVITGIGLLATVLNIIMAHYYYALLNVNALLAVINEELKATMHKYATLFKLKRLKRIKPGALITACCQLVDKLDDLALLQYNLQCMGERINKLFEIQGAFSMLTLYVNNINVTYMVYMLVQHERLSLVYDWVLVSIFLPISIILYYIDLQIFLINAMKFGDLINDTGDLLRSDQPWLPTLDERIDKSLKNFSIQLALFPLQMKLLGLFQLNRSTSFAAFGSIISNAMVLMQYDYKYSNDSRYNAAP